MKKLLSLVCAVMVGAILVGCGSKDEGAKPVQPGDYDGPPKASQQSKQ